MISVYDQHIYLVKSKVTVFLNCEAAVGISIVQKARQS